MSRLANKPIPVPKGITVSVHPEEVEIKNPKKTVRVKIYPNIGVSQENDGIKVVIKDMKNNFNKSKAMLGTIWALLKNAMEGMSQGFKVELELVGVGYRVAAQGNKLTLTLGYSHPVVFDVHHDVSIELPKDSQTKIILHSTDVQILGQVAAEIRSFRFPECYKGKGIKFANEKIKIKETKKK
jgi:large subunit ribosomal protein L6